MVAPDLLTPGFISMATAAAPEKTAPRGAQTFKSAKASDDHLRFRPWVFLAPAMVIYTVVVVYPMIYSSYLSLFRWDGISPTKVFVGLQNYVTLLTQNEVFWIALKNNAVWLVAALLLPTSIGLGFAHPVEFEVPGKSHLPQHLLLSLGLVLGGRRLDLDLDLSP